MSRSGKSALAEFVRHALIEGHDRATIKEQLIGAGWAVQEADDALAIWADTDFRPPVPHARPYVSAREAFFYALMLVALSAVVINVASFAFAVIDMVWQVPSDTHNSLLYRTRSSVATLIVFSPLLVFLIYKQKRTDRATTGKSRSLIRKWFSYGTMLTAVLVLLGDLVFAIERMLANSVSVDILLKLAVVGVLALAVLSFYRADLAEDAL